MKTTIDISDALVREARAVADREGITFRSLVERGLRQVIAETAGHPQFKLRRASFKGQGLQAEFDGASWQRIRDAAYEDYGA